jgi:hypothetical protein
MLIHDDIFTWDGWGGALRLASGKCRLRIIDLGKDKTSGVTHMKPFVVVVQDLHTDAPNLGRMSVRSCCSHIATQVTQKFNIDPARMVFVEYYPAKTYGDKGQYTVAERLEMVSLVWAGGKALRPQWKPLIDPIRGIVLDLLHATSATE